MKNEIKKNREIFTSRMGRSGARARSDHTRARNQNGGGIAGSDHVVFDSRRVIRNNSGVVKSDNRNDDQQKRNTQANQRELALAKVDGGGNVRAKRYADAET